MKAPPVPTGEPGSRRPAPSLRRLIMIHQMWWLFSFVLAGPAALALIRGAIYDATHGRTVWGPEAAIDAAFIAAGVALFSWRASRLRRAFVRGREIVGRVTHLTRFTDQSPSRQPWESLASFIDRPTILHPSTVLCVAYSTEGGERNTQYLLDDQAVARLRPSIGASIALIVDPDLGQPLLRDAYLGP